MCFFWDLIEGVVVMCVKFRCGVFWSMIEVGFLLGMCLSFRCGV
jgi:hypothetical protein